METAIVTILLNIIAGVSSPSSYLAPSDLKTPTEITQKVKAHMSVKEVIAIFGMPKVVEKYTVASLEPGRRTMLAYEGPMCMDKDMLCYVFFNEKGFAESFKRIKMEYQELDI